MVAKKPNITIIVMDTLRADTFASIRKAKGKELSSLGHFIYIDKCIAPASWTLPSHASLFTGMYPSEHGAHETKKIKSLDIGQIKLKHRTFVSDLNEMNYKTYAISANPYVHPVYGFDEFKDFREESYFTDIWGSVFEVSKKVKPLIAKYRNLYGSNVIKISESMLREDPGLFFEAFASGLVLTPMAAFKKIKAKLIDNWPLEKGGRNIVKSVRETKFKDPFFLFINLMEAHDPYTDSKDVTMNWTTPFLKKPVSKETVDHWKKLYIRASQKGYAYVYGIVKDLVERFGDNQIIILTSDHGQEFGEHKFIGHGTVLDDEVVKIPMAIMLPKNFKLKQTKGLASLVNIRKFISAVLKGDDQAADLLFSKEVHAESFGIPAHITVTPKIDVKKMNSFEKVTKRTFS